MRIRCFLTMLYLKENVKSVNIPVGEDEVYKDESETISKTSGTEEYKNNDCNM